MKNYYNILGVDKKADVSEIKKAFRKLAQKYHPDVSGKKDPESEKKFKEINEAYEVLSDTQKRSQYDQFGSVGTGPGGGPNFGGFDFRNTDFGGFNFGGFGEGVNFGGSAFNDIFDTFFGGSSTRNKRKKGPIRGEDIEIAINLSFEEAVKGETKEIEYSRHNTCQNCGGSGAEPGSKIIECSDCQGTGQQIRVQRTPLGQIQTATTCKKCGGSGEHAEKQCKKCEGAGLTAERTRVKVKIPAGIHDQAAIKLSGKGEGGLKGGEPGDLYVHIKIMPSKEFGRINDDIHTTQKIHLLQAILGDEIPVKTIEGSVTVKIPAGTQSGKVFKIKGHGVPRVGTNTRGDHYLKVEAEIPEKLSRKEKELYEALAKEGGLNIKTQGKGIFS